MIRLLTLSLSLFLSFPLLPAHATDQRAITDATTTCEALLDPMRDVMATLKAGDTLSEGQDMMWRTWNKQCRHASWQQALAEGLPPVPAVHRDFSSQISQTPPSPTRTWRHDAVAILGALERGLTAPMYVCTSRTTSRGALMTTCGPR